MSGETAHPDASTVALRRKTRLSVMGLLVGGLAFLVGSLAPTTGPWEPVSLAARVAYVAALLLVIATGQSGSNPGRLRRPRALAQAAQLPFPAVAVAVYVGVTALSLGVLVMLIRVFT